MSNYVNNNKSFFISNWVNYNAFKVEWDFVKFSGDCDIYYFHFWNELVSFWSHSVELVPLLWNWSLFCGIGLTPVDSYRNGGRALKSTALLHPSFISNSLKFTVDNKQPMAMYLDHQMKEDLSIKDSILPCCLCHHLVQAMRSMKPHALPWRRIL